MIQAAYLHKGHSMDHAFITSSQLLVGCPLSTVCCHTHSPCTQGSNARLPTGASSRRPVTPSHHSTGSSHSPRHSRAFQDADSELKSGNSSQGRVKGGGNALLQTIDVAVGGKRFAVRGPSLFLGHPETLHNALQTRSGCKAAITSKLHTELNKLGYKGL